MSVVLTGGWADLFVLFVALLVGAIVYTVAYLIMDWWV